MAKKTSPPAAAAQEFEACPLPSRKAGSKSINLALQGGGAHGAFAWGIIDRLLEDDRLHFEGISGTSAGSMNAVVLAYGLLTGGPEGARQKLHDFWKAISDTGQRYSMVKRTPLEKFFNWDPEYSPSYEFFNSLTRWLSPYQLNIFDFNPLRDVLLEQVDFARLQQCQQTKLFISATNVCTGKVRVFHTEEITPEAILASACLPQLFKAVEIKGEHYWDGGYMGNPSLFPFFYHTGSTDVLLVHINPIERDTVPMRANEILNRVNEISFNSSLLKEFRAIAFVQKLLDEGWIKDEFKDQLKYIKLHSIRADKVLEDLSVATKFSSDWDFLTMLRDRGRLAADAWLAQNYDAVGKRSSVDVQESYLGGGSHPGHDD